MTDDITRTPPMISIAPMMDYTDRHFRYLIRLISKRVLLYTEMVTTEAILRGNRTDLLQYNPQEHPLALQLGGSDPRALSACTRLAQEMGYDEVNLNVGCPSSRVQSGRFGACLMKEPQLVADCIASMRAVAHIPVTVKTRIGVDDLDTYEHLVRFVSLVSKAGCDTFVIHARKAWLKGLSPKENRTIPPLCYDTVYRIKNDFPRLRVVLNGGIQTVTQIQESLTKVDGVMVGRRAYHDPYLLSDFDKIFFNNNNINIERKVIVEKYLAYAKKEMGGGVPIKLLSRHLLGLYFGEPGARAWRRRLDGFFYDVFIDKNQLVT